MKKIICILIICIFGIYGNVFGANLVLDSEKDKYFLDDNIVINLSFTDENIGNFDLDDNIAGLNNFDIISKSSSSSFYSINGTNQSGIRVSLILKAKNIGKFEIGPVNVEANSKKFSSNKITLEILKNEPKKDDELNLDEPLGFVDCFSECEDHGVEKSGFIDKILNNNLFKLSIILIICIVFIVSILLKLKTITQIKEDEKIDDFEEIYPDLNDFYFYDKIDDIFRKKLRKLGIKNVFAKDFGEIAKEINFEENKKNNFETIIDLITKAKYGNIETDKTNLLELVKKF